MRQHYQSGAPWESIVGYSRAVRTGNVIEVSGTVATLDGKVVGEGNAYLQTKQIIQLIGQAVKQLGGSLNDIVRTRIYVTDIQKMWEDVGRAHGEAFGHIRPATSMVEVSALIAPEYLVEIEATAILENMQ